MFNWNPKAHFYLRLSSLILLSLFLLFDLILAIYDPQPKFAALGYGDRISNYFSFFTTQTNYIVALYFFLYLFESKFKNSKPHYVIRLAVTTYITITMLVFWAGIVGQKDQASQYDIFHWIGTIVLHLIMPVTMITSYILTAGDKYYHYEDHHKKYLWLIMIYMILYLTIIMIRGMYRHLDGKDPSTLFPYYFLNYFRADGTVMVATALVVICVLAVALQYFYIWINNLMYFRYYRNKQIKVVPILFKMKPNKTTIVGFIVGIISLIISLIFNIIYVFALSFSNAIFSGISSEWLEEFDFSVFLAFTIVSFLTLVGFIIAFIFALHGKIGGRIAGALLMIALMFFTWITYIGPILCLVSAIILFNGREQVTDITLQEAKEMKRLKKENRKRKVKI